MRKFLKITLSIMGIGLIISACLFLLNEKVIKVKDEDRVAITLECNVDGESQNIYVYATKDGMRGELDLLGQWRGTSVESLIEQELAVLVEGTENLYTIDLTSSLPLGYTSASKFFEDGGKITVVTNRQDGETLIQSKELELTECGNYVLSTINTNLEELKYARLDFSNSSFKDFATWFNNVTFDVVDVPTADDSTNEESNNDTNEPTQDDTGIQI